jgi:hypothetical protein
MDQQSLDRIGVHLFLRMNLLDGANVPIAEQIQSHSFIAVCASAKRNGDFSLRLWFEANVNDGKNSEPSGSGLMPFH